MSQPSPHDQVNRRDGLVSNQPSRTDSSPALLALPDQSLIASQSVSTYSAPKSSSSIQHTYRSRLFSIKPTLSPQQDVDDFIPIDPSRTHHTHNQYTAQVTQTKPIVPFSRLK
ncbi:hypothetical protein DY000_02036967 [Brassica cretica]|uniref:DUF4005 domain-containing protein n=1 Tax=Brassica cretica TaxID=69181 RepID=A0ABQ7BNA7_BRACR|nr:hypothetical protein DY000_02036967 [Brassica cretica]